MNSHNACFSKLKLIFSMIKYGNHLFSIATQALGMEDEDAEMAKAIAKSEEEEEQRLQSELRREGEGKRER